MVFTEGARWRTGLWPDAIVADEKEDGLGLRVKGRDEEVTRDVPVTVTAVTSRL